MNIYIMKTDTAMKKHNRKNWWISSDCVKEMRIEANSVNAAIEKYRKRVENENGISISDNAIRKKQPMFRYKKDGTEKQVGYVITGKTNFLGDDNEWSVQYIDLWVEILTICETVF